MADILENQERLIRLPEVVRIPWLPSRREGRKLNISTVFRWAKIGLGANRIRLETVKAAGSLCTSEEAVKRFFERLSNPNAKQNSPTPSQSRRSQIAAEKELEAAGV
jgi:hypothetical protein